MVVVATLLLIIGLFGRKLPHKPKLVGACDDSALSLFSKNLEQILDKSESARYARKESWGEMKAQSEVKLGPRRDLFTIHPESSIPQ